jgi:hypothetical protein
MSANYHLILIFPEEINALLDNINQDATMRPKPSPRSSNADGDSDEPRNPNSQLGEYTRKSN